MATSLPPFQTLLDAHGRDVRRLLVATVGPIDADDCWQETWLSALRAYPRLSDGEHLRAWVMTIAHRKAIDHTRARARRPVPVAETEPRPRPGAPSPSDSESEVEALLARLDGQRLWAHVAALPPKQRTAVALRYVADLSHGEVAAAMGTTEEAARRSVHEGLKRLRDTEDLR